MDQKKEPAVCRGPRPVKNPIRRQPKQKLFRVSDDDVKDEGENIEPEIKIQSSNEDEYLQPKIKPLSTNSNDNVDGFSTDPLEKFLGDVDRVVVNQIVEKIETATSWLTLGCCKVETENRYELVDFDTRKTLFMADEKSLWCLRNPCICCDCICWCCHSDCTSRRNFTMNLNAGSLEGPLVLELNRPCRSDCLPCCLQKLTVRNSSGFLGSVQQRVHAVPPCTMCGLFEVTNSNKEVIYTIHTPCVLTTCCCTEVNFIIIDKEGEEVGEITKQSANIAKEAFTDADRFLMNFPKDCDVEMKAVLIGALFLFDCRCSRSSRRNCGTSPWRGRWGKGRCPPCTSCCRWWQRPRAAWR